MGKIMIINGSPRAPKSNSKEYALIFSKYCNIDSDYYNLSNSNHQELCRRMEEYSDVLFVFPLYADSLPVGLLNFLKYMEVNPPVNKPVLSVLINCGFLEYSQNEVAVRMFKLFCKQNKYIVGAVLMLGSGEAILNTPFRFVAVSAIKKLAKSIEIRMYNTVKATMPLPKILFKLAADIYWTKYGRKFGVSKNMMQTMEIESKKL